MAFVKTTQTPAAAENKK